MALLHSQTRRVPARTIANFKNETAQAEEVVARCDALWLLIDSMPRHYRDVAGQHLVDEISMALLAAAIEGVDEPPAEGDEDVGL